MPWVVGIDEAGYGPNLGPLVQAAVCLHLPDDDPAGWDALKAVVRRTHEPVDDRLLIDDSKKVYARGGLAALERTVLPVFALEPRLLGDFIGNPLLPDALTELRREAWFDPDFRLPVLIPEDEVRKAAGTWVDGAHAPMQASPWGSLACITATPRFNKLVDAGGSKAVAVTQGLLSLMPHQRYAGHVAGRWLTDDPVVIQCDKLGGRNFYAAIVQQAFPGGWVVTETEGAAESRYRVEGLDRPVTVTFRPRADGDSVAVALASMVCKYLREVCMRQFNRFWATHVPGLAPTAGYPGDAKRYYAAIRPAMDKLGLAPDQVWRKR